jgi:hypothetical protein
MIEMSYNQTNKNLTNVSQILTNMALSESVEASLKEAESNLRNALAYAARQERPVVCGVIADLINKIDNLQSMDSLLDKLENRQPGDSGMFGNFFNDDE